MAYNHNLGCENVTILRRGRLRWKTFISLQLERFDGYMLRDVQNGMASLESKCLRKSKLAG